MLTQRLLLKITYKNGFCQCYLTNVLVPETTRLILLSQIGYFSLGNFNYYRGVRRFKC